MEPNNGKMQSNVKSQISNDAVMMAASNGNAQCTLIVPFVYSFIIFVTYFTLAAVCCHLVHLCCCKYYSVSFIAVQLH